jgi:hypothetical protein
MRTPAKPIDLSSEERVGDLALLETIGKWRRPCFDGIEQLRAAGNTAKFVQPIA